MILLCVAISCFLTIRYLQNTPTLYQATAVVQVEQDDQGVLPFRKVMIQDDPRSLEVLNTIAQTFQNRTLLERVVTTNHLLTDSRFNPSKGNMSVGQAAARVNGMVSVRLRPRTRLIDVTVKSTNAELTELVANAMVQQYLSQNMEKYTGASEGAGTVLEKQAKEVGDKLRKAEQDVEEYKKNTTVSLEEGKDTITPKLKELSAKAVETRNERIRLELDYGRVKLSGTNFAELMGLPVVANDPEVLATSAQLNRMESDFTALKQTKLPKHPAYIKAESALIDWRHNLTNAALSVPARLLAGLEQVKAQEKAYKAEEGELEKEALALGQQAIRYNELQREKETLRAVYDNVLKRLKETGVTKDLYSQKLSVIEAAAVPERPISADKRQVMMQGLLGGLLAGILLALFVASLDTSLKGVDEVEEFLQMPVLGAVPQVREIKSSKSQFVVTEDAKSLAAEAFRTLRTALSMLGREETRKTFLFTSAVPQEGKTFCSLNYAASLAQQGLKTLLIDGDLRRPAVEHAIVGKRTQHIGVTDLLTSNKQLSDVIQTTPLENLFYISAGTTAPNPAELIAQGNFNTLIDQAAANFDRVIVDSAPIHAVSDTLLMLDRIQTVSVVVRANKTPRKAIGRAVDVLRKAGAPLAGVVLNRLPRRRGGGYYYDPYYDYAYQDKYAEKGVYGAK